MSIVIEADWSKYISANKDIVEKHLFLQKNHKNNKAVVRIYSVQFSSNRHDLTGLVKLLSKSIHYFVFDGKQIKDLESKGEIPYKEAMRYFGYKNPDTDGKYGELILYALMETVLKAPMLVHKMQLLTNPRDQVKGGDGIFYGLHDGQPSIFIGESKVTASLATGIDQAFQSLNRFHQSNTTSSLDFEFIVAKNNLREDLNEDELNILYNTFTPGTDEYQQTRIVHPVLVIFNEPGIEKIELETGDKATAESQMTALIEKKFAKYTSFLTTFHNNYPHVAKIFLDFFFIPVSSVSNLRYRLYEEIHGNPYVAPTS